MKACRKCRKIKELKAFSPDLRNPDGAQAHCKKCVAKAARDKRGCPKVMKRHLAKNASDKAVARGAKLCDCCSERSIISFYLDTPKGKTVDHIVEIFQGGHHCLSNLQYLTRVENIRKSWKHRRVK